MRKNNINKLLIIVVGLFITATSLLPSMGSVPIPVNETNTSYFSSVTDDVSISVSTVDDMMTLTYTFDSFELTPVLIDDELYHQVRLGNEPYSLIEGAPELPRVARSIIIPEQATMQVRVIESEYVDYENVAIAPSKGNLLRCVNPEDVAYEFGEMYHQNAWYPSEIAELGEPYILRDFHGQVVIIHPFQFNPVEETLRFYNQITIEIFAQETNVLTIHETIQQLSSVDREFKAIYNHHFINFDTSRYELVSEQGNMVVITYDDFYDAMLPFVEWKNMKGIPTEIVNVSTIGNADAIKNYIIQYYDTYGLTYVLLVGDIAQIPSLSYSGYVSDPSYACIIGGDHYQDLFVGRFSANNLNQLETQIIRSINYEKNPEIGGEWYHKAHGVASNQGPGHGGLYDNQHVDLLLDMLLNFTYSEVSRSYDPWGTTAMNRDAINEGRSQIQYTGHGWYDSWGNGGSFNINNVNALVNDNMLPYIVLVACLSGAFGSSYEPCFAEAWLRATNDDTGEPTGAIGVFASTKSQSWNPPMAGQLEIVNLLVSGINTAIGALSYHGTMYMVDQYASGGPVEARTWTLFGDPSLQIRTDIPASMTVIHEPQVGMGTTFEVTVEGVENALCSISRDGELFGYAYTDASGYAIIEFDEPIEDLDPVDFVVTAFNKEPYITTLSLNTPPNTPDRPVGREQGATGATYLYTTSTIDPDGDDVFYMWDWGDGTFSDWLGPFPSGHEIGERHSWDENGTYEIRVKAKDVFDVESDWSEPLAVTMPHRYTPFLEFLYSLFEQFPNAFPVLRYLLGY
ncbi:MAG: C25 family cysteine peptidase [Thermoplasmatota archaeon]